ncbi:MAG: phosphoglucosamine mutase [Deltaproteobacteria bacterium]|nr:phosphoglucosamine mutase [Deltaproteobacteria bacterium]
MGRLFGTDGIRGEANRYPMDGPTAFRVGQAVAITVREHAKDRKPIVVMGKDTRISGDMLEGALSAGITSMGADVCPVGVLPTPAIAYFTTETQADAGIVISASHNPFQDNGIKIFGGNGFKLSDHQEGAIEELILKDAISGFMPSSENLGRIRPLNHVPERYVSFLKRHFPDALSMAGIKIVLDTANGATHEVAPELFKALGADLTVIHNQPNGRNINDQCGSQHTADLEAKVQKKGAAAGFAFDGDGDRLIAVDETGRKLTGDQILLICARALKEAGRLKSNLLVSTVMSNLGLTKACGRYGISRHESRVGDRYVLKDMQRLGAVIGGEESGHIILSEHHTTSDGIITALRILAVMLEKNKPLSELSQMMDAYPQKLINVPVREKPDIATVPKVAEIVRKVEAALGDEGRVLVRYSGTQNMCRVMVEGPTMAMTEKYCGQIADQVRKTLGRNK